MVRGQFHPIVVATHGLGDCAELISAQRAEERDRPGPPMGRNNDLR